LSSVASAIGRVGSYAQQAWDFAQSGAQAIQQAQQFAGALGIGGAPAGAPPPGAPPPPPAAAQPPAVEPAGAAPPGEPAAAGAPTPAPEPAAVAPPQPTAQPPYGFVGAAQPYVDQLGLLLQALRQRQIPPLPGPAPQPVAPPVAPPAPAVAPQQPDALGLLRMILTNPQLQHAMQSAPAMGAQMPRAVHLPIPSPSAPTQTRSVQIPLAAVMNAIAALSGQSMTELSENLSEEEPEVPSYLVGDDGDFIVDPASPDDRAALVAHLFRLSDEAQRSWSPQPTSQPYEADAELDESDQFAIEAGF
jgi:hypothetical protein